MTSTAWRRRSFARLLLGALCAAASLASQAFSLTPIEAELSPSGQGASQVVRLQNTLDEPLAIEIDVKHREMGRHGEDVLSDAEDDFMVFPAQVVLQPGQSQSVRVQYVGPPLARERAYRLIAEQMPVDVGQAPQNGGRMRVLVKYVASLYVRPRDARPAVALRRAATVQDGGRRWLELEIANDGTAHQVLKGLSVRGGAPGLAGEALKALVGENLLAGAVRVFRLPAPAGVELGPLALQLVVE
jgi:fimbrial chaperone protein